MVVEAADRTQGLLADNNWNGFEVTEKGVEQLENQELPKDLGEQLGKAIAAETKAYRICETTYKALGRCVVIRCATHGPTGIIGSPSHVHQRNPTPSGYEH